MSEKAYELLLEANEICSQGNKEKAIELYKEVLANHPTATQKQIVENQLRELGVYAQEQPRNRRPPRNFEKKHSTSNPKPFQKNTSPQSKTSPFAGKKMSHYPPPSKRYAQHSSGPYVLNQKAYWKKEEQEGILTFYKEHSFPIVERFFRDTLKVSKEKFFYEWLDAKRTANYSLKETLEEVFASRDENKSPKQPVQSKNESKEAFQLRVAKYDLWIQYREIYPEVDLNVALQLEKTGLSLEDFRKKQKEKEEKKKKWESKKLQKIEKTNSVLPGTSQLESWIKAGKVLWFWGGELKDVKGKLYSQEAYQLQVSPFQEKERWIHKVDLFWIADKDWRNVILQHCKVADRLLKIRLNKNPAKRPKISEDAFHQSKKENWPLFFQLPDTSWLKGIVLFFDLYQAVVRLDGGNCNLFLFRHAIQHAQFNEPEGWSLYTSVMDYRKAKHQARKNRQLKKF